MEKLYLRHKNLLSALKTKYESSLINDIPWNEQLVGITGARGVGKTTLMLQYIKKTYGYNRKVLYLSMDDIAFSYPTLVDLAEDFLKTGGEQLFIDEIHKYDNWAQELKNIFDFYPQLKVVFTGSSILDIYKGQADLSRRALIFNMNGLSFREFLQIESKQQFFAYTLDDIIKKHESISLEIIQKVKIFKYWNDYLKHGYYPFYLKDKKYYHVRLSSTLNQIVETDMPLLLNVNPQYVSKIKRLVNILANEIPVKPNITDLASAISVSWQSVIHYLQSLHKARIINIVYPKAKGTSALAKPEKVYLHHPNLFYVFTEHIHNKGNLRETFFVNQLIAKHKVEIHAKGDFVIDGKYIFEVGGKNKDYHQIAGVVNSFIAADDIELGIDNKIPLWLFGFLY